MKIHVSEFKPVMLPQVEVISLKSRGKKMRRYIRLYCGFDIETTTVGHKGYMYIWHISIQSDDTTNLIIYGHEWYEFTHLLELIKDEYCLRQSTRLIIWIANINFEFQFMRKHLTITDIFAKSIREVLMVEHESCIEFRECLSISGSNLEYLAKNYTTTQKLVGDLDYSTKRNKHTPLTEEEAAYCENDVIILSEWSRYIFSEYINKQRFIPMTKTGILRHQIKKTINKKVRDIVTFCMPTYDLYKKMMDYAFIGGIVHGNRKLANRIIYDSGGIDITSSYPYSMINFDNYPNSPFKLDTEIRSDKCQLLHIIFTNVSAKTSHSIFSQSKCIALSGAIVDNGRIVHADIMEVFITAIDKGIIDDFYNYDTCTYKEIWSATKGRLPYYLIQPLTHFYKQKYDLKKAKKQDTIDYITAKERVNSFYGMCVTRLVEREIIYDNDKQAFDFIYNFDYEKEKTKQFLLPQWGVWIAANSRKHLTDMLLKMAEDVIYYDTDSLKIQNFDKHKETVLRENEKIMRKNDTWISEYHLDPDVFSDLGCWDIEYEHAEKFKTLGAKRYICTINGKDKVTVAGLPKQTLPNYCAEHNLDIYDYFTDQMELEISGKKTAIYNDEPHTDIVNGEQMRELSSVAIIDIPFKLTLDTYYKALLNKEQMEEMKYEKRKI